MSKLFLKGNTEIANSDGESEISSESLMAVSFDSISIFPKNFLSRDWIFDKEREGIISISVNNQTTEFPFKGKGVTLEIDPKYQNKILYFGKYEESIQLKIQLKDDEIQIM